MKQDHNTSKKRMILVVGAIFALSPAFFSLAGCTRHSHHAVPQYTTPAGALRAQGVQVIHAGQHYRLVIASADLFDSNSAHFQMNAFDTLDAVGSFLNTYHIVTVRVAAYSALHKRGYVLARKQATAVQDYLSRYGVKARLIYADGEGSQHPVAWNGTLSGRQANYRIEISFHYIPKTTMYG